MIPPAVGDFPPPQNMRGGSMVAMAASSGAVGLDESWSMAWQRDVQIDAQVAKAGPDTWPAETLTNISHPDHGFPSLPLGSAGTDWSWQGHPKPPEQGAKSYPNHIPFDF